MGSRGAKAVNAALKQTLLGRRFVCRFALWPKQWRAYSPTVKLVWQSITYNRTSYAKLPDEPGVYAFVVRHGIANLDDCNFLLYIGKAESQTLRQRCRQYTADRRVHIAEFLRLWKQHLYLYYAALDPATVDISRVEDDLLAAFVPPFNRSFPGTLNLVAQGIYR